MPVKSKGKTFNLALCASAVLPFRSFVRFFININYFNRLAVSSVALICVFVALFAAKYHLIEMNANIFIVFLAFVYAYVLQLVTVVTNRHFASCPTFKCE